MWTRLAYVHGFDGSLEADDLLGGQSDEFVEVKLDVFPPEASVFAVCLSRITRTACKTQDQQLMKTVFLRIVEIQVSVVQLCPETIEKEL